MTTGLGGDVLRRLRDAGPQTKAQLAEELGVPRTTLSASLRALAAAGHVEDGPLAASSGGRRSVSVRAAADRVVVALSLGERRVRVAAIDGHLAIESGLSIDLTERDPSSESIVTTILKATEQVLGGRVPAAIGVATVSTAPVQLDHLAEPLAATYGDVATASLPAERAMALGEHRSGAARGVDDFVAVRLGGSVTTATVAGGRLSVGGTGRAGEIGHLRVEEFGPACVCGLTGCLDSFVSSTALVEQAVDLARRGRSTTLAEALERVGTLDLGDLVAAGKAGDPAITHLARDLGQRLGKVLAGVVAQTDPLRIILGGPLGALGSHLLGDLRTTVYRLAPARVAQDLEVVLSELGDQAVLIGAGSVATEAWISAWESASTADF